MDLLISDNDKICNSYDSMSYVMVVVGGGSKKGVCESSEDGACVGISIERKVGTVEGIRQGDRIG